MTTNASVLSVRDLAIALPPGADRAHAVEHISFDVPPGKIVCLLGESGSGKSVIANAVMGLLPPGLAPVRGAIELQGENLLAAPQARLRALRGPSMAMVFQEPMTALNPVMTCGAQVDEMLAQHVRMGAAERRRKILAIMARVRLPEPERIYASYPHQLSGGQRQRIVIAMALILKPALLICDEPTTALDVTTQAEILKLILELQTENGTAVLFITHDFGVVAEIADEVVVLQLGAMIEKGDKTAVLTAPREPYTKHAAGRGARTFRAHPGASGRRLPAAQRGEDLQDLRHRQLAGQAAHGERRARRDAGGAPRRNRGHRRRVGFGQVDGGALHRAAHRPDLGRHLCRRALGGACHGGARCRRFAARCRSSSRTRTARSTRARRWARPSSKDR
jgi:ABC-type glutathione transport system ATPase component